MSYDDEVCETCRLAYEGGYSAEELGYEIRPLLPHVASLCTHYSDDPYFSNGKCDACGDDTPGMRYPANIMVIY